MTTMIDDEPLTDDEVDQAVSGVRAVDAGAPLGRKADGTPRQRRPKGTGPRSAARTTTRAPRVRDRSKAALAAKAAAKAGTKPAAKAGAPDITRGARGLLNSISALLMVLPRVTRNDAYALDAMAVEMNADALTTGLVEVADQVPLVRAGLEYFAKASPFAALVEALGSVATQIAANHGAIPAGTMGSLPADQLQAQFAQRIGVSLLDIPGALATLTDPE